MLEFIEFIEQEPESLDEALYKKVKVRIRGGKVQRNKKVVAKKGYKMVHGSVKRMSSIEKRKRHLSQRRAAKKRKARMSRALRRRKISIRKSNRLRGIRPRKR